MRRQRRRVVGALRACERGQSLVEFTVSSLLFLVILFGTIEIGIGVWRYNMVSNLAQEGARRAIVCGTPAAVLSSTACDINAFVTGRSLFALDSVAVTPALGTLSPGDVVSVEVVATHSVLPLLLPSNILTLRGTAQMIVAR